MATLTTARIAAVIAAAAGLVCAMLAYYAHRRRLPTAASEDPPIDWGVVGQHIENLSSLYQQLRSCANLGLDLEWAHSGNEKSIRFSWRGGGRDREYSFCADGGRQTEILLEAAREEQAAIRAQIMREIAWFAAIHSAASRTTETATKPPVKTGARILGICNFLRKKAAPPLLTFLRKIPTGMRKVAKSSRMRTGELCEK